MCAMCYPNRGIAYILESQLESNYRTRELTLNKWVHRRIQHRLICSVIILNILPDVYSLQQIFFTTIGAMMSECDV
jgi:hypothetical protein